MNFQPLIILFILTLETCLYYGNIAAGATFLSNVTDQQALLSVKTYITDHDHHGHVLSSWNHSVHFCFWKGITCSRRHHQRVTALDLSSQNLDGTLSPHIGNLSFLRAIYLNANNFRGLIPEEIGKLFRLRYLHLGNNLFHGAFPTNISQCSDIRNISIEQNDLGGKLPTQFQSWSKLDVFNALTNHFTGPIPSSIGNISSLRILNVGANNLTGSIPLEIAQLSKLEHLVLSANNLFGMVPLQLYNISSLSLVNLGINEFEGRLPSDLGNTLPNLQSFYAAKNKFSGPFPLSITNASKLVNFEIFSNNISGPLPMNLGSLSRLEWLNLGYNQLGTQAPTDLSFLGSLVNCTRLDFLGLEDNGLYGELPNSIVNLSSTLSQLVFSSNYIYGSIPQDIGRFFNLTYLSFYQNMVNGSIPESICRLSNLGYLQLGDNNISGIIPSCISNITGLGLLELESNMLHGNIPSTLFNFSSLRGLSLSGNHLSGMIPENIWGVSSLSLGFYLNENLLTGPIPSSIGSLIHLTDLRLSNNKFTGEIPASLGGCVMLVELDMNGNLLQGRIPTSFKNLKNLAYLDLSNNNISGNIPQFLGTFHLIQFLNLSHNKLVGEVPKTGLFSNVSAFSVIGNLRLCGGIQAMQLPSCPANISKTNKKHFPLRIIPLIVLLPLAILLSCFTFVFYRIQISRKKNVRSLQVLQDDQYPRLSYHDLLQATTNFSPNNLLGVGRYGSVFKGILESSQQIIAVKVLNAEVHGANKNFLAEYETLRGIRHRNLIKIITICSSTDFKGNDFKALVLEFMANGSLDNWLHPSPSAETQNERNLPLFKRLNIAIDVALALDYLHHRSPTKIIHCDIKPSNILLDDEFVAHVSDFGLARFLLTSTTDDINQAQTSSTGVRGTIGYVPPEYGMGGKISAEGDVYSYGILLLELFSGQRPTDSSIWTGHANNLHDYVKKALPDRVMEIADPRIIVQEQDRVSLKDKQSSSISSKIKVCLATIFEVGVLCSSEVPRERIDIGVAIKKLHVAKKQASALWTNERQIS